MAIASFYEAKAIVELIDVDRLFNKRIAKKEKADDLKLLKNSAAKFRQSQDHFNRAATACREVQRFAPDDEKRLLALDINTFTTVAKGAVDLAKQMERGILPPNGPVHQLTAMLRDQDVIAERRAVAYQGLPGHLPKGY